LSKIKKLDKNLIHVGKNRKFEQNQKNLWKIFFMWAKIENLSKIEKLDKNIFHVSKNRKFEQNQKT
jgi:hypothetical protein